MSSPNPFENPELFKVASFDPARPVQGAPVAQEAPPAAVASDPRVDQLTASVATLAKQMSVVVSHLRSQSPKHEPKPEPIPEIRTGRVTERSKPTASPYTIRLPSPSLSGALPLFQRVAFIALIVAVVYLLFRQSDPIDTNTNELKATYSRSVEAIRVLANNQSLDLRETAKAIREAAAAGRVMPKEDLFKAIQDSTRRAMLAAGEGPLKALDTIDPWNADVVADRLDSSADAFEDVAKTIERLKKP